MPKGDKLSDRQQKFVEEYMVDLNATQAAIRAEYSAKTARVIAAKNLTKLNIQKEIQKRQAELREKAKQDPNVMTVEDILKEYTKIIRFDPKKLVDEDGNYKDHKDFDKDTARALKVYKVSKSQKKLKNGSTVKKFSMNVVWHDKINALSALLKYYGLFDKR
jgi:phage terminase small subunit